MIKTFKLKNVGISENLSNLIQLRRDFSKGFVLCSNLQKKFYAKPCFITPMGLINYDTICYDVHNNFYMNMGLNECGIFDMKTLKTYLKSSNPEDLNEVKKCMVDIFGRFNCDDIDEDVLNNSDDFTLTYLLIGDQGNNHITPKPRQLNSEPMIPILTNSMCGDFIFGINNVGMYKINVNNTLFKNNDEDDNYTVVSDELVGGFSKYMVNRDTIGYIYGVVENGSVYLLFDDERDIDNLIHDIRDNLEPTNDYIESSITVIA